MNLNVNLILENVIQIKIGITINADVSANIQKGHHIPGIFLNIFVKMVII